MSDWSELYQVDEKQAFKFFARGLKDVLPPQAGLGELKYVASVLAHFAITPVGASTGFPTPTCLTEVFDNFVLSDQFRHDGEMLEQAAAQCLLFSGFFADQQEDRHNLGYFRALGEGFCRDASLFHEERGRRSILRRVGSNFVPWARACRILSKNLRANPYLIVGSE